MKQFTVVIMILWGMVACARQPQEIEIPVAQATIPVERVTETAVSTNTAVPATATTSVLASPIAGLPLTQGNYWVYQWESYEVDKTASYVMTTTVDIVMWQDNYFVAHLRDEVKWIEGSPGLIAIPEPASYWYIVDGQYVYRQDHLDLSTVESSWLEYIFPLNEVSWYPEPTLRSQSAEELVGLSGVRDGFYIEDINTPAGNFTLCVHSRTLFNNGIEPFWFCPGIGVVKRSFDHHGTPYGYEAVLIDYVLKED